jgi:DsbC/DsbD-like thiol-disulfide interchange protein
LETKNLAKKIKNGLTHPVATRLLGALLLILIPASAQKISAPHVTISLISERNTLQPARENWVGLHFQLEKGWHVYWINPGDSGEPPKVEWDLPPGFKAGPLQFPVPERIALPPLMNFGFENDVLFPVRLSVPAASQSNETATLNATLKWVICREVCIPGKGQLALTVPVTNKSPSPTPNANLFLKTKARLPKPLPAKWKTRVSESGDHFLLSINSVKAISQAVFFPAEELVIENAAPQELTTSKNGLDLKLKKSGLSGKPLSRLKGVLVVADEDGYLVDLLIHRSSQQKPQTR